MLPEKQLETLVTDINNPKAKFTVYTLSRPLANKACQTVKALGEGVQGISS